MKKLFLVLCFALLGIMTFTLKSFAYDNEILKFNSDGKFTILMFTDIEETEVPMSDSIELLYAAVEKTNPDLIVYNGDNLNVKQGDNSLDKVKKAVEAITKPAVDSNIPFVVVFGKKDAESGISIDKQLEIYKSVDGCLVGKKCASTSGNGAYNIPIKSSANEENVFNLWFFNSCLLNENKKSFFEISEIEQAEEQNSWYEQKSESLKDDNSGKMLPSIVFQHEPVQEICGLLEKDSRDTAESSNDFSLKGYVKDETTIGSLNVYPKIPEYTKGRFDLWKKHGDVIGAFFGSGHINDIEGTVDGIYLSQTMKSGVRGFGEAKYSGARVIVLDEETPESFDTKSLSLSYLIGNPSNPLTLFRTSYSLTVKILTFLSITIVLAVLAASGIKRILTKRKNANVL